MKTLTLATSVLFALSGCAAELGAPDPSSEIDAANQQLFAQLSDEGDSLVFQHLDDLVNPTERAFVRYGDIRFPVETGEALAESEEGLESLVVTYSFVPVDAELEAALAEASPELTVEVNAAGGAITIAELTLGAPQLGDGASQQALRHCPFGTLTRYTTRPRTGRVAPPSMYRGDQDRFFFVDNRGYGCTYSGKSEYPSGWRNIYTCRRCSR